MSKRVIERYKDLGITASEQQASVSDALLEQVQNALTLAMTICDAVPTRVHHSDDEQFAAIGRLVNCQDNGAHGYAVIRDALYATRAALSGRATIPSEAASEQQAGADDFEPYTDAELGDIVALALAAPQVWYGTCQIADGITDESAVMLIEACSPHTIRTLIGMARRSTIPSKADEPAIQQFDWMQAERIRDEDHVDEALRVFREDPTGDNATGVIQAALTIWTADVRALAASPGTATTAADQQGDRNSFTSNAVDGQNSADVNVKQGAAQAQAGNDVRSANK